VKIKKNKRQLVNTIRQDILLTYNNLLSQSYTNTLRFTFKPHLLLSLYCCFAASQFHKIFFSPFLYFFLLQESSNNHRYHTARYTIPLETTCESIQTVELFFRKNAFEQLNNTWLGHNVNKIKIYTVFYTFSLVWNKTSLTIAKYTFR